jgi:two-component system OmpR family sensor kinase
VIRRLSLRVRLLAITVALLGVGLVVMGSVVINQLESQLMARVDAQLEPLGKAVSTIPPELVARLQQRADAGPAFGGQLDLAEKGYVAYLGADGKVLRALGASPGPTLPKLDAGAVAARAKRPFTVAGPGGDKWRVVALPKARTGGDHADVVAAVSLGGVYSTVGRLRAVCLVAGSLLLAALAVVGGVAIRAGLAPLRRVEQTAVAIAGGDLSRRVPYLAMPGTEVGRLADALNGMLAQIERGFTASAASEARMRRFVADVSHELRTPLFGIKGFSELYRMGGTDAEAALARIESESGRLARLVDDLLLLARLDESTGAASRRHPPPGGGDDPDATDRVTSGLDLTPMDLRTLAADARHDFAALDPGRPVTLTGPDGGPAASAPVLGDEARLRQVVSNLVGNAVAHTPPGTPVRIGVGTTGTDSVLVIEDHGPGLTHEEAARVFDRFYRSDRSRARPAGGGGAGLGLSIVRSITTAHGGRVELVSTPGEGATFRVLLPHP